MQTLRKRNSPCKYKNEPSRFLGEGMTFKAKLIGILEVNEARGDKMCQEALTDLKLAIRAAGEHKQRITISIAIDGLRLRDEKTGDCMYHHPVHKISFIAQDMSDSRAFGYIFGSPDTGHRFFGIKTDKTASQVVISMRDLFQVVFELKKKEIEMAKHHIEQHQIKHGSTYGVTKEETEVEKVKNKHTVVLKENTACSINENNNVVPEKKNSSEAIADLLDLEHELNSIQQGIHQMERITPSDPFGPLSKSDPFLDPFDDSFQPPVPKVEKPEPSFTLPLVPSHGLTRLATPKARTPSQNSLRESVDPVEKPKSLFSVTSSALGKTGLFSSKPASGMEEIHWFDKETESLFNDTTTNRPDSSPPLTFHTPTSDPDKILDDKKSPMKVDVFTDLDPLGTGRVKPYVDKKDFFQELKNPPKKVLKELIVESSALDGMDFQSRLDSKLDDEFTAGVTKPDLKPLSAEVDVPRYSKLDPFDEGGDPFDKTDPFSTDDFPPSIGFPPFNERSRFDVFNDDDKPQSSTLQDPKKPPTKLHLTGLTTLHGPLRVSLPPEKSEPGINSVSLSTITHKPKSSPSPPEDVETSSFLKYYQSLKHTDDDRSYISYKHFQSPYEAENRSPKSRLPFSVDRRLQFRDKIYSSSQSPPPIRQKEPVSKKLSTSSIEFSDTTPDPPPKSSGLFSIKPPPLPPKKQQFLAQQRSSSRPPSVEDNLHYDYVRQQDDSSIQTERSGSPRMVFQSPKKTETPTDTSVFHSARSDSLTSPFPILPPPPHRKSPADSIKTPEAKSVTPLRDTVIGSPKTAAKPKEAVLNITLNQLDQSGLQNLAETLGIPSENIYNMTLQELTKRLAEQYLPTMTGDNSKTNESDKVPEKPAEMFVADFGANFGSAEEKKQSPPPFDRYAVFKELIESESQVQEPSEPPGEQSEQSEDNAAPKSLESVTTDFETSTGQTKGDCQEEDKYAALRQLSLCTQKSENLSEELDVSNEDDSSARAENIPDPNRATDDSLIPLTTSEARNESPATKLGDEWATSIFDDAKPAEIIEEPTSQNTPDGKQIIEWPKEIVEDNFPAKIKTPSTPTHAEVAEKTEEPEPISNWATFEKCPSFEDIKKSEPIAVDEAANSPFSSDGKEEPKEAPFVWPKREPRIRERNDVPWQDEDESWDEYSPKKCYWSDESSHDENSPGRYNDEFRKRQWKSGTRGNRGHPTWDHKSSKWHKRDRSCHDDTEDEYDDSWRSYRPPPCDDERKKGSREALGYEEYREKRPSWFAEREGKFKWEDNERIPRGYDERRKRSESDDEYRRRCEIDETDAEYDWGFKRGCPDMHSWSEKQKQYYLAEMCPPREFRYDHCHESRSKHKKITNQKRPSSASEPKRSYDKMYSPVDHKPRLDKGFSPKREVEPDGREFSRYHLPMSHRETRFNYDMDDRERHYNSYDRRSQTLQGRRGSRVKRTDTVSSKPEDRYASLVDKEEKLPETPCKLGHYYPSDEGKRSLKLEEHGFSGPKYSTERKKNRHGHFQFEDDFSPSSCGNSLDSAPSPGGRPPRYDGSPSRSRLRYNHDAWSGYKSGSPGNQAPTDNNNTPPDGFADFHDSVEKPPVETPKSVENSGFALPKPQLKARNHFSNLGRQDSASSLRKSESINIFSRENDPFEDDDFFNNSSANNTKFNKYTSEKSKSNSNVSDPFTWKKVFGKDNFEE